MNNHPEAARLYDVIAQYCGADVAESAAFGHALFPDAAPGEKIAWATHLCRTLAARCDVSMVKAVRMASRCSLKWENIDAAKELYGTSQSLEDFAAKARANLGVRWEARAGSLHVVYTRCSCPMVNESPDILPVAWCYCTVGYNRDYFAYVLGVNVDVILEKAIKLGDAECEMRITPDQR